MIKPKIAFFAAAVLLAAPPVLAQGGPPPVCEENDQFHAFDFWVGDWDVYSNDENRTHFGTNSVTRLARDCLIMEHWRAAGGGRGYSMNFFDAVTGAWRQVWVANGHSIDYQGGLDDQGRMVLEGKIHYYATGVELPFRGTWTPKEDGTVIQFFEQYDPETETWKAWSANGLLYVPRSEGSTAEVITALMAGQAAAWNAGDFDAYLAHVWHSDDLRYVSDATVIHGWDNVRRLYTRYDTPEKRGVLSYHDISVEPMGDEFAVVFAAWAIAHPQNPDADLSGVLTKVFEKIDGEWVATSIHFSTR